MAVAINAVDGRQISPTPFDGRIGAFLPFDEFGLALRFRLAYHHFRSNQGIIVVFLEHCATVKRRASGEAIAA